MYDASHKLHLSYIFRLIKKLRKFLYYVVNKEFYAKYINIGLYHIAAQLFDSVDDVFHFLKIHHMEINITVQLFRHELMIYTHNIHSIYYGNTDRKYFLGLIKYYCNISFMLFQFCIQNYVTRTLTFSIVGEHYSTLFFDINTQYLCVCRGAL